MQQADPLIRTKLRLPFTRPGLVLRPRLQEQIAQGLRGPLTLIIAPAGFGKTTLVASQVIGLGMPAAWLSLDKDDNQAGRFLGYLIAALREADASIGGEAAQLLGAQQAPPEAILTSLVNDLDGTSGELMLVLDDYHFINNQSVHALVAFLLEHCPRTFHLLIATRSDPPLPLARLRARGHMLELRAADLRFTAAEASQFLNDVMQLGLDVGAVALLGERTEGWIAGLQMAALSMRGRQDLDGFIREFAGTNRFIMDFMLEEVLSREPQDVQTFLLQTSILTRLSGALCDALTGASDGQQMLARLESNNLFVVPLDDDRRWYRYHHLFADLLQARLHQSGPELVARLYSRAAGWCEREGQVDEAVGYALAARDYDRAAGLILRYWQHTTSNGQIDAVWNWLDALPQEVIRDSALLSSVLCWVLWLRGQVGLIESHLLDAERAASRQVIIVGSSPDDPLHAGLAAQLAALRSFVSRYHNDFEAARALAERALSLIPSNLPPMIDSQVRSVIFVALASAYDGTGELEKAVNAYTETIRSSQLGANTAGVTGMTYRLIGVLRLVGRLREAEAACREALRYIQEQGMTRLPAVGILHLAMSEVLIEQNDLEAAQSHLARAIELGKWSGRLDTARNSAYALTRLRLARHDCSGALAAVREAEEALSDPPAPLARAEMLALRARILVRQGALTEAAHCAEEAVRLSGGDRGQSGAMAALAASRVMLARSKREEAIAGLTRDLLAAEGCGRFGVAIELGILRSLAYRRGGQTREAESDLERALALAESGGYARVFLDEGQPMQMLIAQWLAHAGGSPLQSFASRLLAQFELEPQAAPAAPENIAPPASLAEPLSQREMEVLDHMALGCTNQEIARQLIVAPGTVKAHTASIYRKLDVANRTEAVSRARQLGLLP